MSTVSNTILVVDDEPELGNLIKELLENAGYNVLLSLNGLEAMNILNSMPIILVITDILMPEMDGIELVLAARKQFPDLKFVLLSGGGRKTDSDYDYLYIAKKLTGIPNTLRKPFSPEELIEVTHHSLFH